MLQLPFTDRAQAGKLLGAALASRKPPANTIILALPRGGVPVAAEVAEILKSPLDLVVVRKLGVPWEPELAIGAIAGGTTVLDRQLIHSLHISNDEIDSVVTQELNEMKRRERLYRSGLPALNLEGRTAVLIDDGLATGSSMAAAARHVRSFQLQELIIAVPVASAEACRRLKREADECFCLAMPHQFVAVGEWYVDFNQVTDAEVQETVKRYRNPVVFVL
jgi:putative phosphoribosyl transferase